MRSQAEAAARPGLADLRDQVLEVSDVAGLSQILTGALPDVLGIRWATLMLWDRKLDSFETLSSGETQQTDVRSATNEPEARYLISDGQLIETAAGARDGALLPLMARSGLVGMLVLGPRRRRREPPYGPREVGALSTLASRAALALENHLYQRELIDSERMAALGTMAGMLAHDFRGPMTVIRGYAETLLDPETTRDEVVERSETIMRMVDRLERMTTETLDFARGGARLARRSLLLRHFLDELGVGLEQEFPGLSVSRELDALPGDVRGSLDADKLRRAIGNIAANARDAMGPGGRLHLRGRLLAASGDATERLEIEVADEGPGIPEDIRDRLFEPFVTRGKKQGTGLGLAVARRFVEDHSGSLRLLPEGPGARFVLELPLEPPAAGSSQGRRA